MNSWYDGRDATEGDCAYVCTDGSQSSWCEGYEFDEEEGCRLYDCPRPSLCLDTPGPLTMSVSATTPIYEHCPASNTNQSIFSVEFEMIVDSYSDHGAFVRSVCSSDHETYSGFKITIGSSSCDGSDNGCSGSVQLAFTLSQITSYYHTVFVGTDANGIDVTDGEWHHVRAWSTGTHLGCTRCRIQKQPWPH